MNIMLECASTAVADRPTLNTLKHCICSPTIAASVEQQNGAVREISQSTAEVAHGAAEVTEAARAVREGAVETGSSADQSLSAARELGQQADRLRTEVRRFIDHVRAA